MAQPWYTYGTINNYGFFPDPDGPFPKPDINFSVPDGVPITTLLPGTVSGVNTPGAPGIVPSWGAVVTIKLDKPWNSMATHVAYLHMNSVTVNVGQHVNAGDIVGYAGPDAQGLRWRLGLAFQEGDNYGFGAGFQNPGDPNLNPTDLLNQALAGKITVPGNIVSQVGGTTTGFDPSNPIGSLLPQGFLDWAGNPARIFKMVGGVMVLGIALFLIMWPVTSKVAGVALKAAVA